MELNEKIELIDKFINGLRVNNFGTVPEILDGFQSFPELQSDTDLKYRIIENELTKLELAQKIRGGDNSVIGGYFVFQLLPIGIELVESNKSVADYYSKIDKEKTIELKIKEYSLEKLEFERTVREQEQRIRDLSEKLKVISLFQKYWWLIVTALGLGYSIGKLL